MINISSYQKNFDNEAVDNDGLQAVEHEEINTHIDFDKDETMSLHDVDILLTIVDGFMQIKKIF